MYVRTAIMTLCLLAIMAGPVAYADHQPGLLPSNFDSFETGDYRHFLAKYRGDSTEWIRPRFSASDTDPISGSHSLRWDGGEDHHEWFLVSNAFYLAAPFTATVQVRVQHTNGGFRAGLMLLETYEKFSGIHIEPASAGLHVDAQDCANPQHQALSLEPGHVYTLSVAVDPWGSMTARVQDSSSRETLVEFDTTTQVVPSALALYVETPAGSDAIIDFDDITVHGAPYRVPAETWTRASVPHYVVLPQKGDVAQAEGNWVGGHTLYVDDAGDYCMWYRIRNNETRGAGYGFASSSDGLNWEKHADNPLFFPDPDRFTSHEKITVLNVDGTYHGWYTVEIPGEGWFVAYCHSSDGIEWEDEGVVIGDQFTKDPDVVYVNGTFYLYAISPTNTDFAVYTSTDGKHWEQQNIIEMGIHRHPSAYYDGQSETFWLYAFGLHLGVHRAQSKDGIHFSDFEPVWHEPAVGIDDWREGGVDYGQFLRDPQGHLVDSANRILYYQGRNNYGNNHPGWRYHGSERILLAGWFSGLHLGIPTYVSPRADYEYGRFPFDAKALPGFSVQSTSPGRITVTEWDIDNRVAVQGTIHGNRGTSWRFELTEGLSPESSYRLLVDDEVLDVRPSGVFGNTVLRGNLPKDGEQAFRIEHSPNQ